MSIEKTYFWVAWSLMIKIMSCSFTTPTWNFPSCIQLGCCHVEQQWHLKLVLTPLNGLAYKSFMMLSKGLSLIWNTFNWTQGCLISKHLNTIFSVNAEGAQQKECHKVSAIWWCQFTSELQFFVIFCHCCRWS